MNVRAPISSSARRDSPVTRVSVCIPAYGEADFLVRAVKSVLGQEMADFEIVVSDDSPTSEVEDALADVADARVHYFRNLQRLGSPANWIAAVDRSRAPLVKLLHHDDYLTREDSLSRFVAMLDDPKVDFAFSASQVVDAAGSPLWVHRPADRITEMRTDPYVLLLGNWIGAPSATIYRRASPAKIDTQLRWVVDIDLYLSVLARNRRFAYDELPLVATTTGSPRQVTTEVQQDPTVGLAEWFVLAAKWAPPVWRRGELLEYLRTLQIEYGASNWKDYRSLGLRGRSARLFVLAHVSDRFSREDEVVT